MVLNFLAQVPEREEKKIELLQPLGTDSCCTVYQTKLPRTGYYKMRKKIIKKGN